MNDKPLNIETPAELLSIALQAGREAVEHYVDLAHRMRAGQNDTVADLFERLVGEERSHEQRLRQWMEKKRIEENPQTSPFNWRDPHLSPSYVEEARDPYFSTPYRALAYAVYNEENAFRFYTQVAAESKHPMVQQYAEMLAREELGHAAELRAERRKAYHVERLHRQAENGFEAVHVHDEEDLLRATVLINQQFLQAMQAVGAEPPEILQLATEIEQEIAQHQATLDGQADSTQVRARTEKSFDAATLKDLMPHWSSLSRDEAVQWLCATCERSFAFYDAIVSNAEDEQVMLLAQQMASTALERIAVIRRVFCE